MSIEELKPILEKVRRRLWELTLQYKDLLFGLGCGINLHAVASELYQKGGYLEILRPQGEYFGLALMVLAYFTMRRRYYE